MLAWLITTMFGGKGTRKFKPDDFTFHKPKRKKKKPQTVQEQIRIAEMVTIAFGGKDLRKSK